MAPKKQYMVQKKIDLKEKKTMCVDRKTFLKTLKLKKVET